MRLAAFLLVPVLFSAEPPKLPEPFRSISDLAAAAPPELASDALLRIVESGKLADKNARRAMIEQAFQLASAAKFHVRMQGVSGTTTDTASGSLSQAYGLKLDVVSLQSRAVRDMLPIDPGNAHELFGQLIKPTLAPLTCDDALVYEPSEYFLALSAVVNGAFTAKEKAKDEHFNLLLDSLGVTTSPSQLAPLAGAIESVGVTSAQRQLLWARFNGLIETMQPDGRSLGAAPEKYRPKGHLCEAKPKLDRYWQSATAKQLLEGGKKLRFAPSNQLLSDADRSTLGWQQQLAAYLNLIADWTPDSQESEAVFYHEKCLVYTSLLDLVPAGPDGDKILADFVDFVGNSALYQSSPAEWFLEPHTVLDRTQSDPARHAKILEAYQHSGNPALALAVALEKAFGGNASSGAIS
jgi:hypothetical protein